jgi:diadenosine tetraphosphate (Ap4A) HIT family hydrolase
MPNETLFKFHYPSTLLHEYRHWVVLLRPKQITLGSLVLACKEEATRLSAVSTEAFAELKRATTDIEGVLTQTFAFEKINYLCLMMVDQHVHFHVIPRYASPREACGKVFVDADWPKPPDVTKAMDMTDQQFAELQKLLQSHWPR